MTEISDVTIPVYNTLFVSKRYFANSQFSIMYVMDIISMMLLQNESYRDNMEKPSILLPMNFIKKIDRTVKL